MQRRILITGGAGFIGSHLADELLAHGYTVRVLDNLTEQVHGKAAKRPGYLDSRVELLIGDVRDPAAVDQALEGVTSVVHLAAAVGVGQSMYQIREYTEINNLGTAVLLDRIGERKLDRLVVASSMSVYGEGSYVSEAGVRFENVERSLPELKRGVWDPTAEGGVALQPVSTREAKPPMLTSVYALSKYDQERLCLMVGRARGIPTVALRLFNTYGPRQALSNPYTGVLAIFASQLLNGRAPQIFEDGQQRRDFVNVRDVARAFRLALESERAPFHAINIGSGVSISVAEVARRLSTALQRPRISAEITGKYRVGDVRHCFADISRARELLGFQPEVGLAQGLEVLVAWLKGAEAVDRSEVARRELELRGLTL
jgi:dTDP-L-rhamnose 4-epimerase